MFDLLLACSAFRENRLTSLCVSSAIHGGRSLSFACPKESNQRETAPSDPRRSRSERFAAGERVWPTGHPWPVVEIGAIPRAARALRGFSVRPSPLLRGTREPALTLALSRERERGLGALRREGFRFCGRDCRASLFPGPLSAAASRRRNSPQSGRGRMPASSTRAHGCALGEPRSLLAQSRGQDARVTADARVPFSWLLLFGQAKRSNRRPWMADEPHTDVSRSSRRRRTTNQHHPHPTLPLKGRAESDAQRTTHHKEKARLAPGFFINFEQSENYEPGFSTFISVRRLRARPSFVALVSIGCDSPKPLTAVMRLGSIPCEVR